MHDILDKLGYEILFFDGAMGTILQGKGLLPGEAPELWNLQHPEVIQAIHASYLAAGAHIIKANTFGANPFKCQENGCAVEEIVPAGMRLARQAVEKAGRGAVALDIGPTGRLLAPLGDLPFEDAVEVFACMVRAGAPYADCILIETMNDLYEAKAAVLAAQENSRLPVFVTMTFDEDGKLLTGGSLSAMAAVLEGLGVTAMGLNCGLGPRQMVGLLQELREYTGLPLLVNPNAGLPQERDGCTCFDVGPEEFSKTMKELVEAGAWAVGGCCGTTPQHIAQTVRLCAGVRPGYTAPIKRRTVVASGIQAVEFGHVPVIIGERINPTGKARFKQALRENDIPYILGEGIAQQDAGAHLLDVNVGLPEIDECALMCRVVGELQSISPLPLQIDTSDPETMGQAMRMYNGKPLVNSVTAKAASMAAIFPLVQKYGGVVIGLTITEEGIPGTAEGRVQAAKHIIDTAAGYGIGKQDIIIDPLTMAVSAGQDAALVTLEALRRIRRELGVCTSLGISNVSFGLPQRDNITSAFFLMALADGLNAAILNPRSEAVMRAYRSFCALSGMDKNCMAYIEAYSQAAPVAGIEAGSAYTLRESIEKGLKEAADGATRALLREKSGLDIIDGEIVPALDQVGRLFEKKERFLPQLLASAEAAKAAFDVIKGSLGGQPSGQGKLTVVIATVKGDVHDIGKNIVKVLLENYGFHVVDLGKDVPPEAVLEAVERENAQLVGLSALMTTTVSGMKETIMLLRQKVPQVKIMVGGAVLTQEYADKIGADFYGPDAMASVRYAMALAEKW